MTKEEALNILHNFQKWRRGANTAMLDPKIVGEALDIAIRVLRKDLKDRLNETEERID